MVSSFELQILDNKMKVPRNLEYTAAGDDHHSLATMYLVVEHSTDAPSILRAID